VMTCDIGAVEFVPAGAVAAGAMPASASRALRTGASAVLRRGRAVRVAPERFVERGLGPAAGRP